MWFWIILIVMLLAGGIVEYYERKEIRRLRLYRDAARAAASRGYWMDREFEARRLFHRRDAENAEEGK